MNAADAAWVVDDRDGPPGDDRAGLRPTDDAEQPDAADDQESDALDAAYTFARDVERQAYDLRVRDAARRKVAAERDGETRWPDIVGLREFLAVDDPPAVYRVDRLWPVGGRVVLAAQWKAGKTTVVGNLLRSLADGAPFLGSFATAPAGSIVLLDNELDERTLRRWLRAHHVVGVDAVRLVSLRGQVASLNLLDPHILDEWAERLAGAQVVALDCLRPVLDALGLDESREAGRFLVAFDALLRKVGTAGQGAGSSPQAADGLIVHHMGHHGERSRGDSRILDWPDATWNLVREDADDPASPRYLSAFGRDVDVPEGRLDYTEATRQLRFVGGNRRDGAADALVPAVLDVLTRSPEGLSGRKVEAVLTAAGHGRNEARQALARAVLSGAATARPGPSNAILHTLSAPVRHSAPGEPARPVSECASAPIGRTAHTRPTQESLSAPGGALTAESPDSTPLDFKATLADPSTSCTVCAQPLNPRLAAAGETTHPTCDPEPT